MDRTELTGVAGVPETAVSEAVLGRLPANEAPAPWDCVCEAVLWFGRGGRAAAQALPPALRGAAPGLVVVGAMVRYLETPVGAYDEVLGLVGSRSGVKPWGSVAFMSVAIRFSSTAVLLAASLLLHAETARAAPATRIRARIQDSL